MIYCFINIFIGAVLVFQSFRADRQSTKNQSSSSLVNMILFSSMVFFSMGITVLLTLKGTKQFALISGRFSYMLMGWLSVFCVNYLLVFPDRAKTGFMKFFQVVLFILALYFSFIVPNGVNGVEFVNGEFNIITGKVFTGKFGSEFKVTWLAAYSFIFRFAIPAFVSIMVLVRAEHLDNRLLKQNVIANVAGVVLSWAAFLYIKNASLYMPFIYSLAPVGFLPMLYTFIRTNDNDEVHDYHSIIRGLIRFLVSFAIPVAIVGFAFIMLAELKESNTLAFQLSLVGVVSVVVALVTFIHVKFGNSVIFRAKRYAENFEKDITVLDFTRSPQEITDDVFKIFKKYLGTSTMKIVMDDGTGHISAVYSSDGDTSMEIPFDHATGDAIMNAHRQVIFREQITRRGTLAAIKGKLLTLFNQTNTDAIIMLNEGRNFIGLILLGPKASGNIYSEYDFEVFNRFYSNLFVVGYYVKNIMNESVVGTVNREIRMSGQIITSIQENMDLIKSKKVDAGYLMIPAHNIGGEFVDMIRLTDTRHIFIIGALSGKGIAASMGMVILKSIIRTFLAETTDFKKLVAKVNVFIRDSLPKGTFFAGIFGLLDFNNDTLYYINCGSPALYVYTRAYNNVIEVQGEGHILGFVKDISPLLKVKKVKLAEGDIIMSVTDGILDTKSLRGDIFGKSRTQTAFMDNSTYPAEKMTKFAYEVLTDFASKELENDVTMLVIKYLGNRT